MGTRYHIKSAILTFGGSTFDMESGPSAKGQTREATEVTALSDSVKQFIPGALTEDDEFTVTLYDKGSGMPSVSDAPAALSIAVTLSNGEDADVTANVSYAKAIVTKVSPPSQEAKGERLATVDVTFRPNGQQSSGTQSSDSNA